jgi:transcriptional regulator with XRE-family HTH domain
MPVVPILDGGRIKAELTRHGLSQSEFAARYRLRESAVSYAVRGRPLGAEAIYRIALGIEKLGELR